MPSNSNSLDEKLYQEFGDERTKHTRRAEVKKATAKFLADLVEGLGSECKVTPQMLESMKKRAEEFTVEIVRTALGRIAYAKPSPSSSPSGKPRIS